MIARRTQAAGLAGACRGQAGIDKAEKGAVVLRLKGTGEDGERLGGAHLDVCDHRHGFRRLQQGAFRSAPADARPQGRQPRHQAINVIGLGGKDAKPYVLDGVLAAVKDPDQTVAVAAIDALPLLHAFETMPTLKSIMADKRANPDMIEAAA